MADPPPVAGPSTGAQPQARNPQLGNDPWFAYPTPTPEQLEEELPPYLEEENVPMGMLLDRLARRGYGDLRVLLGETCVLMALPHTMLP